MHLNEIYFKLNFITQNIWENSTKQPNGNPTFLIFVRLFNTIHSIIEYFCFETDIKVYIQCIKCIFRYIYCILWKPLRIHMNHILCWAMGWISEIHGQTYFVVKTSSCSKKCFQFVWFLLVENRCKCNEKDSSRRSAYDPWMKNPAHICKLVFQLLSPCVKHVCGYEA